MCTGTSADEPGCCAEACCVEACCDPDCCAAGCCAAAGFAVAVKPIARVKIATHPAARLFVEFPVFRLRILCHPFSRKREFRVKLSTKPRIVAPLMGRANEPCWIHQYVSVNDR